MSMINYKAIAIMVCCGFVMISFDSFVNSPTGIEKRFSRLIDNRDSIETSIKSSGKSPTVVSDRCIGISPNNHLISNSKNNKINSFGSGITPMGTASSGWMPDVPIDSSIENQRNLSMTRDGAGNLYVAFENWDSVNHIFFISTYCSLDGGLNWSFYPAGIWWSGRNLLHPSIAATTTAGDIMVACDMKNNGGGLGIVVSGNISGVWNYLVVTTDSVAYHPSLTFDNYPTSSAYAYLTYETYGTGLYSGSNIMFTRSTITPFSNWSTPTSIVSGIGIWPFRSYNENPSIAYGNNGDLYVTYEYGGVGSRDIYVIQSPNYGSNWNAGKSIASVSNDEYQPRIAASHNGNYVVVVYTYQYSGSDTDIYYAYTLNSGTNWYNGGALAASILTECGPDISCDWSSGNFSVVYQAANNIIYYQQAPYNNPTGWSLQENVIDSYGVPNLIYSNPEHLAVTSYYSGGKNYPAIAWRDNRNLNENIYYTTHIQNISIYPSNATIIEGKEKTFSGTAYIGGGYPISGLSYSWSTTGGIGTVSPSTGPSTTFTAFTSKGGYNGTIIAFYGPVSGNAMINVTHDTSVIKIAPISSTIIEGKTQLFSTKDKYNHSIIANWSVPADIGSVSPTNGSTTTFTANTSAGGKIGNITATNGTATCTAQVNITHDFSITPSTATVIEGKSINFTATDKWGHPVSISWSLLIGRGSLTNITGISTTFNAGSSFGGYTDTIKATSWLATVSKSISITHDTSVLTVSPKFKNVTEGKTQIFSVTDKYNHPVNATWTVSSLLGVVLPTFGKTTIFNASTSAGDKSGNITATIGMVNGIAHLNITHDATLLSICPTNISITEGDSQPFSAYDRYGHPNNVTWSIPPILGTLSNKTGFSTIFTANTSIGNMTENITATNGSASVKTKITICHNLTAICITTSTPLPIVENTSVILYAKDIYGHPMYVKWNVSSKYGTLDNKTGFSSKFTALPSTGNMRAKVNVSTSSVSTFILINIIHDTSIIHIVSNSSGNITTTEGKYLLFSVTDRYGDSINANWNVTNNIGNISNKIGASTNFTAFSKGECNGTIIASNGSIAIVNISIIHDISIIHVWPGSVYMQENESQTFVVTDFYNHSVVASWDIIGAIGNLSTRNGNKTIFTACLIKGKEISGKIIAEIDKINTTANITIKHDTTTINLEPTSIKVFEGFSCNVSAKDKYGHPEVVSWSVSGVIGKITAQEGSSTVFIASTTAGGFTGKIVAKNNSITSSSDVTVLHDESEIIVNPVSIDVIVQQPRYFYARDKYNHPMVVNWSVNGNIGEVNPLIGNSTTFTAYDSAAGKNGTIMAVKGKAFNYSHITVYGPDLSLGLSDITLSKNEIINGKNVTIYATLHNFGHGNATNIKVRFLDGGSQIGTDQPISSLKSGAQQTVQIIWAVPFILGFHNITVVVDPNKTIYEDDETNNAVSLSVRVYGPDIVISESDVSFSDESIFTDSIIITAIIHNNGQGNASDIRVTFRYTFDDKKTAFSTTTIASINKEQQVSCFASFNPPEFLFLGDSKTIPITITTEIKDGMPEENYSNNNASTNLTITCSVSNYYGISIGAVLVIMAIIIMFIIANKRSKKRYDAKLKDVDSKLEEAKQLGIDTKEVEEILEKSKK